MEQQFLPKEETLFSELSNWNNIEKLCASVYSEDDLKSSAFQRLKMQEYQRLFAKYGNKELSLDERALHKMLQYKSQAIEKELYPDWWRRVLQRGVDAVTTKIGQALHSNVAPMAFEPVSVSTVVNKNTATDKDDISDILQPQQRPEAWWVQDLGQKNKKAANEKKLGI